MRCLVVFVLLTLAVPGCAGPPSTEPGAEPVGPSVDAARQPAAVSPGSSAGQPVAPRRVPSGRPWPAEAAARPSLVLFEPFGPTPGVTEAEHDQRLELLRELHYDQPGEPRRSEIERLLHAVHIVDLTPEYLDLLIGLDMAERDDVALAASLVKEWYLRQLRYKQVLIDGHPDRLDERSAANRLLAIDGWRRMWQRTLENPARVSRFKKRIDDLLWERERLKLSEPDAPGGG